MSRLSSLRSLSPLQSDGLLIIDIHIYLKTSEFCYLFLRHEWIGKFAQLQIKSLNTCCAWSQQTCWAKCTMSCLTLRLPHDSPPWPSVLDLLFFATRVKKHWSLPWHVTGSTARAYKHQRFPEGENGPQAVHNPTEHYLHCCIIRLRSTLLPSSHDFAASRDNIFSQYPVGISPWTCNEAKILNEVVTWWGKEVLLWLSVKMKLSERDPSLCCNPDTAPHGVKWLQRCSETRGRKWQGTVFSEDEVVST